MRIYIFLIFFRFLWLLRLSRFFIVLGIFEILIFFWKFWYIWDVWIFWIFWIFKIFKNFVHFKNFETFVNFEFVEISRFKILSHFKPDHAKLNWAWVEQYHSRRKTLHLICYINNHKWCAVNSKKKVMIFLNNSDMKLYWKNTNYMLYY